MEFQAATMQVSRYDWTLYHQAIAKAKRTMRREQKISIIAAQMNFTKACDKAYARMMKSPDTETVEVKRYVKG